MSEYLRPPGQWYPSLNSYMVSDDKVFEKPGSYGNFNLEEEIIIEFLSSLSEDAVPAIVHADEATMKETLVLKPMDIHPAEDELEVTPPISLKRSVNQYLPNNEAYPLCIGVMGTQSNGSGQHHATLPLNIVADDSEAFLQLLSEDDYGRDKNTLEGHDSCVSTFFPLLTRTGIPGIPDNARLAHADMHLGYSLNRRAKVSPVSAR